jgi:uncharacterized cupredoxin-like copper-binding protein
VKCYVPAGPSTIVELVAGDSPGTRIITDLEGAIRTAGPGSPEPSASATDVSGGDAETTVTVTLVEYSVQPDAALIAPGSIEFVAENASESMVHELAVLKARDDGSFDNVGEIEDIAAGEGGTVTLELEPGSYQLACLLVPGEAGSTVDHYQQGMHTDFAVTE